MAEAATLERLLRAGRLDEALALCHAVAGSRNPARRLRLYGQVVLPAIRRLESDWQTDQIGFGDLSMTFFQLDRLLSQLSGTGGAGPSAFRPGGVLVATAPGEEHAFGVKILSDLLQASGIGVTVLERTTAATLARQVADRHLDAICLSVGHDQALDGLADLIADLRGCSLNAAMMVLIGGTALVEPRQQYHFLGADVVALSAEEAMLHLSGARRAGGSGSWS